jgi:hypothetical protein
MLHWTLSITAIPASQTVVILVGILMNPALFGGGGSLHQYTPTSR